MIARSSSWTPREVCEAVGGSLSGEAQANIRGIATDTRDELTEYLFVALKGERFDAHDFLDKAVAAGASALLVESDGIDDNEKQLLSKSASIVEVDDSLFALGELAATHRQRSKIPIIALTGSNGKTTTKEMIASILACEHHVLKTEGNFNNLIGLPMTLLGLTSKHDVGVIEMGMNARGEIQRLTQITEPAIGLITNVGPAHIGKLGSMEQVIRAKAELFEGLTPGTTAVFCADDDRFYPLVPDGVQAVTFGFTEGADVCVQSARRSQKGQTLIFRVPEGEFEVELPYPGRHNAINAAAAVASVLALEPKTSFETFRRGLSNVNNAARRLELKQVGSYLVVDDCYNANGDSMVAAIETVASIAEERGVRWVAVLGEMRELGAWSESEHARVGSALCENKVAVAGVFGPEALPMLREISDPSAVCRHEPRDFAQLYDWVNKQLESEDVILVKGSRGTKMERFIEQLQSEVE
jgi:UDP-N-acetylmuramoyl-tripeptide--D-alanyl-D-alanine ligase